MPSISYQECKNKSFQLLSWFIFLIDFFWNYCSVSISYGYLHFSFLYLLIYFILWFQVHHDMTAPLSHYFIYTGHNSYLTGNQLSSDCSDVPIINALKKGVRVIELDIWPNSDNDDVEVLHGRYAVIVLIMASLNNYRMCNCYCERKRSRNQ